ncbi:MAG TPA: hypothetical protein VGI39_26280, partial [Polyangiaceae bacterium]
LSAIEEQVQALREQTNAQPAAARVEAVDTAALSYALAMAARRAETSDAAAAPVAAPKANDTPRDPDRAMSEADMRARLDVAATQGPPDPEWSRSLRRDLADRLAASGPEARLQGVDCKQTLCRVEIVHRSRADYERFMSSAVLDPRAPAWSTPSYTSLGEPAEDGSVVAVSFISKNNDALPLED